MRRRDGGGWLPRPTPAANASLSPKPPPGRPGLIEGERPVMEADGRMTLRRATCRKTPPGRPGIPGGCRRIVAVPRPDVAAGPDGAALG